MSRYYAIGDHVFLAADVEQAGTSAHARPVVVIDPEGEDWELAPLVAMGSVENVRDVLRAIASPTPPKPEEPTGLGAVVETPGGRYVRSDVETCNPWRGPKGIPFEWDDLDGPVRVLSEGVTA